MTMESSRQFVVDHVPDEDAFANSRRGQQTPVGRPAAPINFVGVTLEGFEHISIIAQVPDLKLSIIKKLLFNFNSSRTCFVLELENSNDVFNSIEITLSCSP